jgi:hypothetical protein
MPLNTLGSRLKKTETKERNEKDAPLPDSTIEQDNQSRMNNQDRKNVPDNDHLKKIDQLLALQKNRPSDLVSDRLLEDWIRYELALQRFDKRETRRIATHVKTYDRSVGELMTVKALAVFGLREQVYERTKFDPAFLPMLTDIADQVKVEPVPALRVDRFLGTQDELYTEPDHGNGRRWEEALAEGDPATERDWSEPSHPED